MVDGSILKQNIFIVRQLARREKFRENASSNLGQVWQILNPFINMMILVILFSTVFALDDFVNYPLYICTGTILYELFVQGTNGCMCSLVTNKQFLIKTSINKNIYVVEKLYLSMINMFFSMIIYAGLMIYYRVPFRIVNILCVFDIAIFCLFVLGVGKILAVIYVGFADIKYFYSIFTLFVFYGTAIFYNPERLSLTLQKVMSWNPIYIAIAIARQSLIDGIIPSIHLWMKMTLYAVVFYSVGSWIYRKGSENIVAKL